MNQGSDNSGFWTHFCSGMTWLFTAIGLTTEQWIYVLCALLGAMLSLLTYLSKRRSDNLRAMEDAARTEILRSYVNGRKDNSPIVTANIASEIKHVMDEASQ